MQTTPPLSVLVAAPVPLKVSDSFTVNIKPLTVTVLGKWLGILSEKRRAALPTIAELMSSLKGHSADAVTGAIRTINTLHQEALDPPLDELLAWMTSNPLNIFEVIKDCAVESVDADTLFAAVLAELNSGGDFPNRWMQASGVMGNPTKPS